MVVFWAEKLQNHLNFGSLLGEVFFGHIFSKKKIAHPVNGNKF